MFTIKELVEKSEQLCQRLMNEGHGPRSGRYKKAWKRLRSQQRRAVVACLAAHGTRLAIQ